MFPNALLRPIRGLSARYIASTAIGAIYRVIPASAVTSSAFLESDVAYERRRAVTHSVFSIVTGI